MSAKKVLIITYYWPPSGGAGVQRWLKLTKYLVKLGVECHVVTVDPDQSSYTDFDTSLAEEIDPKINIYHTKSFEPTNIYKKIAGSKNVPKSGFSNVDNNSWKQKLVNGIRSNFFIPDPRVGWNKYAFSMAKKVIQDHQIDTVITTSPPHSTQLVGLALKEKGLIKKWIVDFRDPWTDIYYYHVLNHSKLSHRINLRKEQKVLDRSDQIITVSEGLVEGFLKKSKKIKKDKFVIVPNGFDKDDFSSLKRKTSAEFRVVYTGTMSSTYQPEVFLEALAEVNSKSKTPIKLIIVGSIAQPIKDHIDRLNIPTDYVGMVPHTEVNQYQLDAELLLLVIPRITNAKGILTGKLFEYLASKNRIICVGPQDGDAAAIVRACNQGETFEHDQKIQIQTFLDEELKRFEEGNIPSPNDNMINKYSREEQATKIYTLLK